jgi:hypothetical protein
MQQCFDLYNDILLKRSSPREALQLTHTQIQNTHLFFLSKETGPYGRGVQKGKAEKTMTALARKNGCPFPAATAAALADTSRVVLVENGEFIEEIDI